MDNPILISSGDEESDPDSAFSIIDENLRNKIYHEEENNAFSEDDGNRNSTSHTLKRNAHDLSDSDSDDNVPSISDILSRKTKHLPNSDSDDNVTSISDILSRKKKHSQNSDSDDNVTSISDILRKKKHSQNSDSDDDGTSISDILSKKEKHSPKEKKQRKKVSDEEKQRKKEEEERKKALKNEEKQRKKEEEAKKKAEKKATSEVLRKMKPGECMKYVTVFVDTNLLSCPYGGALLAAVQSSGAESKIDSQLTPYSITWIQENTYGIKNEQNRVVIIWTAETLVVTITRGTLYTDVLQVQELHPNKIITIVIFGMEKYFRQQKANKTKAMKDQITGSNSKSSSSDSLPEITRSQLEESLTEIQLLCNCCHRLLETGGDIGLFVSQMTKAIAETPYKKTKFDKTQKNLDWFATGDSKDCVRIDKNGNGLSRLWQKQICQFNLVGLDLADAVINRYKTPQALVTAYDECESSKEAELLLQDLPVRRAFGPIVSSRRVGPELSKKLYLFFTSDNESTKFSQES